MRPVISIIVPSYNRGDLIGHTIESVQAQSYRNWELIIVDDGSKDNSNEVIKGYLEDDDRLRYVKRPVERSAGGNGARNYGFEIAQGEYIKWLDSDDLLAPECLKQKIELILKAKKVIDVVFCRSKSFMVDQGTNQVVWGKPWHPDFPKNDLENEEILEYFILGKYRFSNNDGLWRKDFLKYPPYNERLRNSQEWLMIIEALSRKPHICFLDDTLVFIRNHEDQMPGKRSYSSYAANQCYSRYIALKRLKEQNLLREPVTKYLMKSMVYYPLKQIQKLEFNGLFKNLAYFLKSLKVISAR